MARHIRRVCRAVIAAGLITAGGCLIYGAVSLYVSGRMYSIETITAMLEALYLPLCCGAASALAGTVISALLPREKAAPARADAHARLCIKQSCCAEPEDPGYKAEAKLQRRSFAAACGAVCLCVIFMALAAFCGGYLASNELEAEMGRFLPLCACCCALALAAIAYALGVNERRSAKLLELLKGAPSAPAAPRAGAVWAVRAVILAVSAVFIAIGILNGGFNALYVKAVNICTECIGLG